MSVKATRLVLALLFFLVLSTGFSQTERFGARIQTCVGIEHISSFPKLPLCSISGFYQLDSVGVFVQTRPIAGPLLDNWQVGVYTTTQSWRFGGITWNVQPGIAVGREDTHWFVNVTAEFLLSWTRQYD